MHTHSVDRRCSSTTQYTKQEVAGLGTSAAVASLLVIPRPTECCPVVLDSLAATKRPEISPRVPPGPTPPPHTASNAFLIYVPEININI